MAVRPKDTATVMPRGGASQRGASRERTRTTWLAMAVRPKDTATVMPRDGASKGGAVRGRIRTTWLTMAVLPKDTATIIPRDGASRTGAVGDGAVRMLTTWLGAVRATQRGEQTLAWSASTGVQHGRHLAQGEHLLGVRAPQVLSSLHPAYLHPAYLHPAYLHPACLHPAYLHPACLQLLSCSRTEAAMAAEATTGSARQSIWSFSCSRLLPPTPKCSAHLCCSLPLPAPLCSSVLFAALHY
ncbi:unnamed protein product [Closterium sp. Naga37s-1]|nr:unnamed protein product [Closterium sp. Naga37s-1]